MPNNTRPSMPLDDNSHPIPALGLGTCQPIVCDSASHATTAMGTNVFYVSCTVPFHIDISPTASATTSKQYLAADTLYAFKCKPTDLVAVTRHGAVDGTAYISPAKMTA